MTQAAVARGVRILSVAAAVLVAAQIGRMSIYMVDADATGW